MPTYIYETLPQVEGQSPKRFEIRQSMNDAPLTHDPDSGLPVRRVIVGGTGVMGGGTGVMGGGASAPAQAGGGSCGSGCGCH